MKRFLLIFLILPTMLHAEWFGPKDTLNSTGIALSDMTEAQAWRCLHTGTADSAEIELTAAYADDTTWVALYAYTVNGPTTLIAKTDEYYTGTVTGYKYLQFPASTNLSENTYYFLTLEHRNGDAGNATRARMHRDTLRQNQWYYYADTVSAAWDTTTDTKQNNSQFPWIRIFYTPTVAYDTTARDTSLAMGNDATLERILSPAYPTYGTQDSLWIGRKTGVPDGYDCYAIMGHNDAKVTAITSILQSYSDIMVSCSTKFKFWNARGALAGTDEFYIYPLKIDSSGTQINFDELRVDQDTIRADAPNRALWTSNGAASAGNDYYNFKIDSFAVQDTTTTGSTGWYVFGGDTANYTGWMKMADSINNGAWVWRGLLIKAKTALAYGDLLILYSAESANDPVFWYESFALSQQATGGATTDRHGETNRHGAYRH